ncbi:polysaccharide biosynthesis C-terminal domain-containing protein [Aestuariibacter sp. A3R04]|uniref:oligosaccharide flippase family protein n=1 Tax=Aestuariibacter sp. A3R04 TaxID=2841571 RepID=UPI001C09E2C6|nr:oligosaccharide flippase family protein [Aestuariibacter sp. A3R04]MBU3023750.1 polysaccharide biosynthesis C-terminal domain-containing protein [Aestuariibacter sp. A3R04]
MGGIIAKLGKLMSVRMLAIGLTFLQTIVITRVFGSEVFGLLSFALSISALAVLILSVGLDTVLMRDIARIGKDYVARSKRWRDTWSLVRRLVIPVTLTVSVIGVVSIGTTSIAGEYRFTVLTAFIILPFVICRKYMEAICQGTKQVVRSITGSQIIYPLLMILGSAYVWYFGIEPNAISISWVYGIAVTISLLASFLFIVGSLRKMRTSSVRCSGDDINNELHNTSPGEKKILVSGVHFSLISLGFVLGQHIDVLLMGVLATPEEVGIVRIAARIAEMAALMRTIILLQYKPLLAESYGKNDTIELQRLASFMTKIYVVTGLPITLGLWIFAEEAMMVFGADFVEGAWAMRIYVLGVFITLIFGPSSSILAMTDSESLSSKILFTSLITQLVLDLLLIPFYGVIGCAIANCTGMLVLALLSRKNVISKLGIEPSALSCVKWIKR